MSHLLFNVLELVLFHEFLIKVLKTTGILFIMLSFKGWKVLLSIPIKLLAVLLKYPFAGGVNKKFKYDLLNSLKLILYRTALHMPVRESALLSIMSNHFIINKLIKNLYPTLTKLPSYGKNTISKATGL